MGLRTEHEIHKRKTINSFKLISEDISNLTTSLEQMKNILVRLDSRNLATDSEILSLKQSVEKCVSEINLQQNQQNNLQSKIDFINQSMSGFNDNLNEVLSQNRLISKKLSLHDKSLKKLLPRSRKHGKKIRKLGSLTRILGEDTVKIRNLIKRKIRTSKRMDLELEDRIRKQRRLISRLNRKIDNNLSVKSSSRISKIKKITKKTQIKIPKNKKTSKKATAPKKTIIREKSPKKIVTTVITPRKKVTTKITPKTKTTTTITAKQKVKKVTRKGKTIVEIRPTLEKQLI